MKEKFRLQFVGKSCIMFLSIQKEQKDALSILHGHYEQHQQ